MPLPPELLELRETTKNLRLLAEDLGKTATAFKQTVVDLREHSEAHKEEREPRD